MCAGAHCAPVYAIWDMCEIPAAALLAALACVTGASASLAAGAGPHNLRGPSMRIRSIIIGAAAVLGLAATPAFACKGKNTLFSDDFREVDDSWNSDAAVVSVEDGRVKIKPQVNVGNTILYPVTAFDTMDYCVTIRMPNKVEATNDATEGGMIFWASDYSNYFKYAILASGDIHVSRLIKNNWTTVLAWKKLPEAKTGAGAKNRLRVTTAKGTVTFSINDVKFGAVKSLPPVGAGQIGLFASSEKTTRDAWKFSDLVVTDAPQ